MSNLNDFRVSRSQDAWATLRGFKYQIDLSILRLFALKDGEYLELERGEDIDLVANAMTNQSEDAFARVLEQVKVRSNGLTLRRPEALESLANAVAHMRSNPELRIRFCYTTNAPAARERPNPFPGGRGGIELWEHIRLNQLSAENQSNAIVALRRFLGAAARPTKVSEDTWDGFIDFVNNADASEFLQYVQRFEWSSASAEPADLAQLVRTEIRRSGASDELQVEELYHRLHLSLVQLLTGPGVKRVTKDALREVLTAPTLSASDHAALTCLANRFQFLESRIEEVEETVSAITAEVQALVQDHHVAKAAIDVVGSVSLDPPRMVEHVSLREDTVTSVLQELGGKRGWLALHGASDEGKTHLAVLVSRRIRDDCPWVRFNHDMTTSQATVVLQESLRDLASQPPRSPTQNWYLTVCRELGTCIVLDDIPRVTSDNSFLTHLETFAGACFHNGVTLISTSRFRLPEQFVDVIGSRLLAEVQVPRFTESEATEVLSAHGAPTSFFEANSVRFINGIASGHPLLLAMAGRFFQQRGWRFENDEFEALIRGDHASGVADDVVNRLCQSLDIHDRELLYRASLAIGTFRDSVVVKLAEVEESVDRPKERLTNLIGAWIQREADLLLRVSPLVGKLGKENLAKETLRSCHLVLAEEIARDRMTPWDAQIVIGHYMNAGAVNLAGATFLSLLGGLRVREPIPELGAVLGIWRDLALPSEMRLELKLLIRAMQFCVLPRYGRSDEFALADLDNLMSETGSGQATIAFHVASLAAFFLASRDCSRSLRYFRQAMSVCRGTTVDADILNIPRFKHPAELLWTFITHLGTPDDLEQWLVAFKELEVVGRRIVVESKDAHLGCVVLADRMMTAEMEKPFSEQNWPETLRVTKELYDHANDLDWEHLAACALKAEINIHGDFLRNLHVCEERVRKYVGDESLSSRSRALASGMYGRMLAGAGEHGEALPWLERAISEPNPDLVHDHLMTLLAAVKCCASDQQKAISYAERAAEVVRSNESVRDIEATKAFAELAIAILGADRDREASLRAYPPWSEAAERMLMAEVRDDEWKDLFVLFGHAHTHFSLIATTGAPPDRASDGSPSAAPVPGMFFTSHPDRIEFFRSESIPSIMWLQSKYAASADDHESATKWLRRALAEVDGMPLTPVTAPIRQEMVPDLLLAGDFAEAIDAGIRGAESLIVAREISAPRPEAIAQDTALESLVAELSADGRKLVDRFSVVTSVVPAMLKICIVEMESPEKAQGHAAEIAALCRQTASTAADPQFWTGAADVFNRVVSAASHQEIIALSHSFDDSHYQELRILGYLASTMEGDPSAAFHSQLAIMERLTSWYPPGSATHSVLLVPYMGAFWPKRFREQRFQFRSPAIVEQELEAAVTLAPPQRIRGILRAVRHSFRVLNLHEPLSWLNRNN